MNLVYCRKGHYIASFNRQAANWQEVLRLANEEERGDSPHRAKFCGECGAQCLTACDTCNTAIRSSSRAVRRPNYCFECSKPFPWTAEALTAAKEYTDELKELSLDEKIQLKETFSELTTDTVSTPLAVSRFKRITAKLGPVGLDTISKILISVVTEAAKKAMTS